MPKCVSHTAPKMFLCFAGALRWCGCGLGATVVRSCAGAFPISLTRRRHDRCCCRALQPETYSLALWRNWGFHRMHRSPCRAPVLSLLCRLFLLLLLAPAIVGCASMPAQE